jgi:hypothetical protein
VDQQSNNVSLFNLIEQINVPDGDKWAASGVIPLEMHAYWHTEESQAGEDFEVRFVMVASTGLESASPTHRHRGIRGRFRTRIFGLPCPPVTGAYTLRIDWRYLEDAEWRREGVAWPVLLSEMERPPRVTH